MSLGPLAKLLEALHEHAPDPVLVVGGDRLISYVNPAFENRFGYAAGEVAGRSTNFLFASKSGFDRFWTESEDSVGRCISRPRVEEFVCQDGKPFSGETVIMPLRTAGGALAGTVVVVRDVGEDQLRNVETTQTERLFLDVLESSGETAWRLDIGENRVELAGPAVPGIFGAKNTRISLTLDEWKRHLDAPSRERCMRHVEEMIAHGESQTELVLKSAKGQELVVSDRGRIIKYDGKGKAVLAAGVFTDITEHRKLEQRFAETDIYLSTALEAADLAAWRIDLQSNMCRLDGPLVRLVEMPNRSGEITGEHWCSFVHRDDLGNVVRQTIAMAEGQSDSANVLYRIKDKAGNWRWISSIGRVTHKAADGRNLVTSGIIKDVTESIELNEKIEADRNRFETIFRNTPAMLHQIDHRGVITDVSAYWLSHLGYARDEVIGKRSVDFLTEESRIYAEQHAIPDFMATGRARNISLQFRKKNGEIIDGLMNAYVERLPGSVENIGYGVITDVTQLRRAYRDLERSNRELDRFATIASHDLQEPLRKISAFAGMLRTRYATQLDQDGVRCVEFLVDAASRLQQLIDNMLEYAQLESRPLHLEKLSMREIVGDISTRLETRISATGAKIELAGVDTIIADKFLLTQIIQNLMSNAIKYRSQQPPDIRISVKEYENSWELSVSDNGIGFDPKFSQEIFEPFRRLHARGDYDGAGIGLAIVRQAADRQNGRVSVETRPNEGSVFTVSIPRALASRRVA